MLAIFVFSCWEIQCSQPSLRPLRGAKMINAHSTYTHAFSFIYWMIVKHESVFSNAWKETRKQMPTIMCDNTMAVDHTAWKVWSWLWTLRKLWGEVSIVLQLLFSSKDIHATEIARRLIISNNSVGRPLESTMSASITSTNPWSAKTVKSGLQIYRLFWGRTLLY